MTDPLDLSALKALEEKATAGPWRVDGSFVKSRFGGGDHAVAHVDMQWGFNRENDRANIHFIAASRTALPSLIKRVEELEAERDGMLLGMNLTRERTEAKLATVERETVEKWKPLTTYKPGEYKGYDEILLLGWDDGDPDNFIMFFGCGYLKDGRWQDCSDHKPWPNQPSHWLLELRSFSRALAPPVTTKESGG